MAPKAIISTVISTAAPNLAKSSSTPLLPPSADHAYHGLTDAPGQQRRRRHRGVAHLNRGQHIEQRQQRSMIESGPQSFLSCRTFPAED